MTDPNACPDGYEKMDLEEKTMVLVGLRKIQQIDRDLLVNEFDEYFWDIEPLSNDTIDDLATSINARKVCIEK